MPVEKEKQSKKANQAPHTIPQLKQQMATSHSGPLGEGPYFYNNHPFPNMLPNGQPGVFNYQASIPQSFGQYSFPPTSSNLSAPWPLYPPLFRPPSFPDLSITAQSSETNSEKPLQPPTLRSQVTQGHLSPETLAPTIPSSTIGTHSVLSNAPSPVVLSQNSHLQPHVPLSGSCVNDETSYIYLQNLPNGRWPLTPQGNWALDLSHSVVAETSNLAVDWACHASSGKQRAGSSKDSSMLDLGHRSYRQCLGTIHCGNPDCAVTIRPHTHGPSAIRKQLSKECKCGNQNLTHHSCPNKSAIVRWSGGVRYMNGIHDHNHEIPSYRLHLTKDQESQFIEFVHTNPKASPAALISGNTVDGFQLTQ
ncbi:hypothetical protein BDP27DRAFT_1423579 [Rhodocollybia butyracea]|uniref:Uncharacterized protein n=1 Tax=Rhodocollybia butyracea TaxID=206335 RepID=A0A9P5U5F6_9AGAR|nr:hypothetical protein BDP27DRAFT_1423579 [Rhodocollybia butyracea]